MRRSLAMLAAAAAMSGVMTLFSPTASTAQAAVHDVCTGVGNVELSSPFFYPGVSPIATVSPHSATFTFHIDTGTCAPSGTDVSASGTIHGWCGLSVGSGVTSRGNRFHWVETAGRVVFTGEVSGTGNLIPNVLAGDSCFTGADDFLFIGAMALESCAIVKSKTTTSLQIGQNQSVASVHVVTNPLSAHAHVPGSTQSASVLLPVGAHGHLPVASRVCV